MTQDQKLAAATVKIKAGYEEMQEGLIELKFLFADSAPGPSPDYGPELSDAELTRLVRGGEMSE